MSVFVVEISFVSTKLKKIGWEYVSKMTYFSSGM